MFFKQFQPQDWTFKKKLVRFEQRLGLITKGNFKEETEEPAQLKNSALKIL